MLGKADSLKAQDLLDWSEYFLSGLKNEVEKIDRILDENFAKDEILLPAMKIALDRQIITDIEHKVLKLIISKREMQIKSEELSVIGIEKSKDKSKIITELKNKNILSPTTE